MPLLPVKYVDDGLDEEFSFETITIEAEDDSKYVELCIAA